MSLRLERLSVPIPGKIYIGDSITIMRSWADKSIGAIVTDPVWPYCSVKIAGRDRPFGLFQDACREFARLTDILIVHLGCMTDIRILKYIPKSLRFRRVCWLRKVPCVGRGHTLDGADVAYIFGKDFAPASGHHLAPGETTATFQQADFSSAGGHPCPRNLKHVMWLVHWFTRNDQKPILDPFAGSGTTLLAAERTGRPWIGIEVNKEYAAIAENRIAKERRQPNLQFTVQNTLKYSPSEIIFK